MDSVYNNVRVAYIRHAKQGKDYTLDLGKGAMLGTMEDFNFCVSVRDVKAGDELLVMRRDYGQLVMGLNKDIDTLIDRGYDEAISDMVVQDLEKLREIVKRVNSLPIFTE